MGKASRSWRKVRAFPPLYRHEHTFFFPCSRQGFSRMSALSTPFRSGELRRTLVVMLVYRSMIEARDGKPLSSPTARGLGVRVGIDISADEDGDVHYGLGGMSVSPNTIENLPRHRRPREHRGFGEDPTWELDLDELPGSLRYRDDDI